MSQQHPDPITEAFLHSGQRLVQVVTLAAGAQQLYARRRAQLQASQNVREAEAQRAEAQAARAALTEASARWARVHDREWLSQAGLLNVAEAWGAAIPYTDSNAAAAYTVRKCEERLRELHPHAMSHYDRFRGDGHDALTAMSQAVPFFMRAPNPRTGDPVPPRNQLNEGTGAQWAATVHGPDRGEWEENRQQQRARQIADELRTKLRLQGREPSPEELRTVLDITTNLPHHIIARAIPTRQSVGHDASASDRTPAAEDFPHPIDEALELSAKQPIDPPTARRAERRTPDRNRRRNL